MSQHPSHFKGNPDPNLFLLEGGGYSCPCCTYHSILQYAFQKHMDNHLKHAVQYKGTNQILNLHLLTKICYYCFTNVIIITFSLLVLRENSLAERSLLDTCFTMSTAAPTGPHAATTASLTAASTGPTATPPTGPATSHRSISPGPPPAGPAAATASSSDPPALSTQAAQS